MLPSGQAFSLASISPSSGKSISLDAGNKTAVLYFETGTRGPKYTQFRFNAQNPNGPIHEKRGWGVAHLWAYARRFLVKQDFVWWPREVLFLPAPVRISPNYKIKHGSANPC
jgi:hypothetical protein